MFVSEDGFVHMSAVFKEARREPWKSLKLELQADCEPPGKSAKN